MGGKFHKNKESVVFSKKNNYRIIFEEWRECNFPKKPMFELLYESIGLPNRVYSSDNIFTFSKLYDVKYYFNSLHF